MLSLRAQPRISRSLPPRNMELATLLELAKELGLDRALYSRKEAWVQDCLAMIVGRIVYAGSKLALSKLNVSTDTARCTLA